MLPTDVIGDSSTRCADEGMLYKFNVKCLTQIHKSKHCSTHKETYRLTKAALRAGLNPLGQTLRPPAV